MERLQVQEFLRKVGHAVQCNDVSLILLALGGKAIRDAPEATVSFSTTAGHPNVHGHACLTGLNSQRLVC